MTGAGQAQAPDQTPKRRAGRPRLTEPRKVATLPGYQHVPDDPGLDVD